MELSEGHCSIVIGVCQVILIRDEKTDDYTAGVLYTNGQVYYTLERPWKDNERNISCIPNGEYHGKFVEKTHSGRYRNVYYLSDVPNRSGILIHHGNIVDHTHGCILIGRDRGYIGGKRAVLYSRSSMIDLVAVMGEQDITLRIYG